MKALTFSRFGTPDVLEYIDVPMPEIKDGEVLVQMKAIGLNYADIYRRKGNYHLKGAPPYIAGYEGAGIVAASQHPKYTTGDRVAFADVPHANAEYVVVPGPHVIPLPENIDFTMAASILLQGLTADYLCNDSYAVKENDVIVVHAASGGVGQILTQLCKLKGATVIGLTRDANKLETIAEHATQALLLDANWTTEIMKITNNKGADAVYDSVGSTLADSIAVAKECGHIVFYGMSGGDPKPVDPRILMDMSKTLTGGDLWSYLTSAEERQRRAGKLFDLITSGDVIIKAPVSFSLSEGKQAHEFLESGSSAGKILLIP